MKNEILPKEWTYVTFCAKDLDKPADDRLVWFHWVVEGHPLRAEINRNFLWKEATKSYSGGRLVEVDMHTYRNNYRRESRTLIQQGRYTPSGITAEELIQKGYEPFSGY